MDGDQTSFVATKYLLAIIPNEPILGQLLQAKKEITKYIIKEQELLPHIMLSPKFSWDEKQEYLLIHEIKNLIPFIHSFEVDILQIDKNIELNQIFIQTICKVEIKKYLDLIHDSLIKQLKLSELNTADLDGRIIMAGDDFNLENFTAVYRRLSKKIFSGVFIADKISLFKNLGNSWELVADFHLN